MNLYIVELPERLPVAADVQRVAFSSGTDDGGAIRNYLFRSGSRLSNRGAAIVSAHIRDNGGYEQRAHLVPEVEFMDESVSDEELKSARFYAFAQELAGGKNPDLGVLARASKLWAAASRRNQ
ncbi:hypothetical protein CO038_01780 [Candidatus Pacearchaeota archaeon CG_4_9_14_0_2_um_filter_39_13]|nr:hypothetical protein [Candidatus Pacearchaeota archaeon]OIO43511.1 MAG: hypothetical protein AUJ64_02385 [Candidatus Pacearchaeota archaeon CG1_02_39_14]PJC44859.1 MAG: hypothetical protein CO038_01780 [Candidatus Pacearchaeota archaeon CG_4_9_14_0_2_um_filter_39_13]